MTTVKQSFTRRFMGRQDGSELGGRLPPGQSVTKDFPVLSAGATPHTTETQWDFSVVGAVERPQRWNWMEFHSLPREPITADIHCVTKWSKLDTKWEGVALDTLLGAAKPQGEYVLAFCSDWGASGRRLVAPLEPWTTSNRDVAK